MSDRIVSIGDRALDTKAMGVDAHEYAKTRDVALVKEVLGAKLTWFNLRPVPVSLFRRVVRAEAAEATQMMRAFQVGVASIENYVFPDGRVGTIEPKGTVRGSGGDHPAWTDAELDVFPDLWMDEIGGVVWQRCFLGVANAGSFPVPPTLLRVLVARVRLDAEQIQAAARQSKLEPPPATDPDATTPVELKSDAGTAATATASATS